MYHLLQNIRERTNLYAHAVPREEQCISIYLSALKLGLFKADPRHLYARAAERMNSPVSPSLPCANPLLAPRTVSLEKSPLIAQ